MQAVKWVYVMALAVWIGSIIFFSFAIAPTVFKVLQPEEAARLQRALFPKYYAAGIVCAAIGLACVAGLLAGHSLPKAPAIASLILLGVMGATDLWLRQSVVPRMTTLREQRAADPAAETAWKSMHKLSVVLNLAVLMGGAVLVWVAITRMV